jgi:hypothetical protein
MSVGMEECRLWDKVANGIGRVSDANRCQIQGTVKTGITFGENMSARVKHDMICEELTLIHSKYPRPCLRSQNRTILSLEIGGNLRGENHYLFCEYPTATPFIKIHFFRYHAWGTQRHQCQNLEVVGRARLLRVIRQIKSLSKGKDFECRR